ncbi:hypothetical protein AS9A_0745 [Hoyosella subflava DQS3-9A1]|uniref:Uncharacterized protein n=1 Tax=Hoyosella subflava (strain DSM 45089 / JCM 17490 / NBRC 109087 / DQS3-9A1) TaxID=443218 RepID=F6ELA8_HOYSD|nr:hypothetical protein AS9A_0745 [Hoyosella subflava DQS3-9A1]
MFGIRGGSEFGKNQHHDDSQGPYDQLPHTLIVTDTRQWNVRTVRVTR